VTPLRAARAALTAAGLAIGLSCATSSPVADVAPPCLGLAPPKILAANLVALPQTYVAANVGAEMPVEVTVGRDGTVDEVAVRTSDLALLAPYAEESLKRSRFAPGTFEGNPVAVRVPVRVSVGAPPRTPANDPGLAQIWAHVADDGSREARWQLRGSVSRLTLIARLGRSWASGATIVAVAPGGAQKTLLTLPATSSPPPEIHQTVATGKFFAPAGNYRLELRTAGGAIASAHLTIADDSTRAVVNACEPLSVSRRTGPGN
jgi:Gram-negative bacterial TonB protein C-terminal